MEQVKEVSSCYHACPFFALDGGPGPVMFCSHPYWKDKGAYSGCIITQQNSHGRVPDECPLRNESVTTVVRLRK